MLWIMDKAKDPHAAALGKKGGAARAKALTPQRRKAIARKAARKRWQKVEGPEPESSGT